MGSRCQSPDTGSTSGYGMVSNVRANESEASVFNWKMTCKSLGRDRRSDRCRGSGSVTAALAYEFGKRLINGLGKTGSENRSLG
jgi:hypothetical protein